MEYHHKGMCIIYRVIVILSVFIHSIYHLKNDLVIIFLIYDNTFFKHSQKKEDNFRENNKKFAFSCYLLKIIEYVYA